MKVSKSECAQSLTGDESALAVRDGLILNTRDSMGALERLRKKIEILELESRFDGEAYPPGLTRFPGILKGQGFFPGGDGLWRDDPASANAPPFPVGGIMILGNDFGCEDNPDPKSPGFKQCLARGFEEPRTWSIKDTLIKAGRLSEQCFFTNAYLGLRTESPSTGRSPGAKVEVFKAMCRRFLHDQIQEQKPRLIVCLGHEPRLLLASMMLPKTHVWNCRCSFKKLDSNCNQILRVSLQSGGESLSPVILEIAHPSFAWSNRAQAPRTFRGYRGEDAEVELLRAAWAMAQEQS